jgi:hypothetical protein
MIGVPVTEGIRTEPVTDCMYDDQTQTGYAIRAGEGRNRQRKPAEALNYESKQWV